MCHKITYCEEYYDENYTLRWTLRRKSHVAAKILDILSWH